MHLKNAPTVFSKMKQITQKSKIYTNPCNAMKFLIANYLKQLYLRTIYF